MTAASSGSVPSKTQLTLATYAHAFAFCSAASVVVSIFVSHVTLGLATVFLLASRTRLRIPPVVLPLAGAYGVLSALCAAFAVRRQP